MLDRAGVPNSRFAALAASVCCVTLILAACGAPSQPGGGPSPSGAGSARASTTTTPTAPTTTTAGTPLAAGWTTYQNSPGHTGEAAAQPPLSPLRPAWSAHLDGSAVYGQPLHYDGRVIVATEDDHLFALDPATGNAVWSATIGSPLRSVAKAAGCGDIDPLGVTSTPVIDPATGTVYVLAEVSTGGRPPIEHRLVGVDIRTGRITLDVDADPPLPAGEDPIHLLQRAALALGNGRIYVGYGGQYGDCGTYHGWLVAVRPTSPASLESFDVTPGSTGGAVWDGGAGPVVGPDGSVYVNTGNPNSPAPAPWSEAVLRLAADLAGPPLAAFRDPAATDDLDLSTGGPVLLPGGTVFAAGKTETGYLLRASDLRLIGTIRGRVCGSDPDGGTAFDPASNDLYVPCRRGGIQQVLLSSRRTGWRSDAGNSTPVLADGELWALDYVHSRLVGIDPSTGRVLEMVATGDPLPHFASLSITDGLLVVPTTSGVVAFR